MLVTFCLIVLASGGAVSLLTNLLFWYETARRPHPATCRACSGLAGILGCIVRGLLSSFASLIILYITYPAGFAKGLWTAPATPRSRRPPVLLVHGLYHNASAWLLFRWMLHRAGFAQVFCRSYNTLRYDFWELAGQFKGQLLETARLCNGEKVICIGHSLGGLLIRAALADPETAPLVSAAVTLGTPHQGSKLASLALGKLGRSLIYKGMLVRTLNTMPSPAALPKLNVYSPIDNMVLPVSSLSMPDPGWTEQVTAPISHVSMLYHLPTIGLVLRFLEESLPHQPRAGNAIARGKGNALPVATP